MKKLKCILGVLATLVFLTVSTAMVFAEAGPGGPINGGSCGDYWDTCFGATWQYYADDRDTVVIPTDGNAKGGTITGCGKYGGYYRLGLATHRNGVRQALSGGKTQAGIIEHVYLIYNAGGTRIGAESTSPKYIWFREGDPYGIGWQAAYEKFKVAEANGATNGYAWRDIGWFCYDKTWDNPGSKFVSKSTVEVPTQTGVTDPGTVTSPEDGEAMKRVTTTEEEFTATFWHEIFYKNGLTSIPAGATFDDVSTGWTVSESGGQNRNQVASGTYTTNGGANASSGPIGRDTVTVHLEENEKVTICHRITYSNKNITFGSTTNGHYADPQYSDQGSSRACVEVTRSPDPNAPAGEGGFWSTTTVKVPQQNDIPGYEATTGESKTDDREVEIKFSTDKDSVEVVFTHNMYYDDKLWSWSAYDGEPDMPVSSKDVFPDVCSTYEVTWEGDITGSVPPGEQQFCTKLKSSGDVASTTTYTITGIQPDKPVTVCQKINHDKINVEMTRTPKYRWVPAWPSGYWVFDHWEYSEGASDGTGWTKACVTVTRPSEPEENENSITSGGVNNWIKYAGEVSTVGWNPKAISQASRRLAEYKAINYLVPARVQYYADITKGNIGLVYPNRQNIEPCTYYRGKSETVWCDVLASSSPRLQQVLNLGPVRVVHTLGGSSGILGSAGGVSKNIATPDYVGYKYCNSFGYRWEYWYSITKNGVDNWQKETRVSDYWTNYGAACRTIAKKPSAAAWNGGVLTNGGITASTSPRILGISETGPQAASPNQFNFVYGSWSEYLAVIGKNSNLFASGDMFSRGSNSRDELTNSPLTIANSGSVGGSGITTSQALRTRLESYLMNHPTSSLSDVYTPSATTKIVTTGSINIDRDIIYPDQNYSNIYQLPQNVIFVNGDVTIEPGVRRIDAWIIATGNINTCKVRESNKATATVAVNYNRDTTCDQQLVFNGPVMAGSVSLNRTYGSDPKTGSDRYVPAEIFNLSAGTYLWAYAQAGRYDSSYTEAYSRELAPRY